MVNIRYLSYFARNIGKKSETIDNVETIKDLFKILEKKYPEFADVFGDDNPDISLIMSDKSLILPRDLHKQIDGEIIIGPIVKGGS